MFLLSEVPLYLTGGLRSPRPTGPLLRDVRVSGPRLRKGEVFAYVGLPRNLKDLKDSVGTSGGNVIRCPR